MNAPNTLPVPLQFLPAGHDRRKYLGGSDAAAIVGVGATYDGVPQTPYVVWEKKVSGEPEDLDPEKQKFFRNRKAQEPIIAARLEQEYGIVVTRLSMDEDPNRYVDQEHEFMVAEIDFEFRMSDEVRAYFPERADFAAIPNGTLLNGEIKTVHPLAAGKWGELGSEDLPIEYAAQVMWGLGVTRRPACLVAALFGIDALLCFPVMADWDTIAAMRAKAFKFWTEHVLQDIPPDPINIEDVVRLYRGFNGKPVLLSDEAYEALRNLDVCRKNEKAIENEKNELEWRIAKCVAFQWGVELAASDKKPPKPIIAALENAVLMFGGAQAGSWNRQSRAGIDTPRLKKEKPDVAAAYATVSTIRVFRLKKET